MFFVWMLVELIATTTNLFAVNTTWRGGYAAANPSTQAAFRTLIAGWAGVWDGLYFLLAVP